MIRTVLITAAAAATLGVLATIPASATAEGCTAGALSNALGATATGTGAWLEAHPEANNVITSVGETGNRDAVRDYFIGHQAEWQELQAIAQPLRSLRDRCGGDGAAKAASIGDLYQAQVGG